MSTHRMSPAVVVYESWFGSTRHIAEAIATGAGWPLMGIHDWNLLDEAAGQLIVLGAPTHAHGLSRPASRTAARSWANDPDRDLTLDASAGAVGVREWLRTLPAVPPHFVAFDTRMDMPEIFTGSAAKRISSSLRDLHSEPLEPSESFLVDRQSHLIDGEIARATAWGRSLRAALDRRAAAIPA